MASPFPTDYDNLPDNRVLGGPDPANDNNAQADAVNAAQHFLGIVGSGNVASIQSRLSVLESTVAGIANGGTVVSAPTAPSNYWGFDDGKTEGWAATNSASVANDSTYSHSPGDSLKVSVSSASGGASFTQTVATGQNWLHRIWVHGDPTSAGKFVQAYATDVGGSFTQYSVPVMLSSTQWKEVWALVPVTGTSVTIGVQGLDLTTGMSFWVDDASLSVSAAPVMTTNSQIVLKNGTPTRWTGIGYYNTPIGLDNNTYGGVWMEQKQLRYDLEQIKAANLNSIRIYWGTTYDRSKAGAFLDECLRNGIDVWIGYYSPSLDYTVSTGSANRTAQQAVFTDFVTKAKYHPAVVGYLFGNEMNYNYGPNTTDAVWYPYLNSVLAAGKAIDPNRLMGTANGQIAAIQTYDSAMTSLDVWGANMYQNTAMGGVEDKLYLWTSKPFMYTEYGNDRYDTTVSAENQGGQSAMVTSLMRDIDSQNNVCGSYLFEFNDEYWKGGNVSTQQPGGYTPDYNDPFDITSNEAYYGITHASAQGSSAYRTTTKAYLSILAYRSQLVQSGSQNQINALITDAIGREDGFLVRDTAGNRYRAVLSPRFISSNISSLFQITPFYNFQAESAVSPILKMDGTSMLQVAGLVTTWNDISGVLQGNLQSHPSFNQFNSGNGPTFNSAVLNGKNTLSLTGNGVFMEMNNFPLGNNVTVFMVCASQRTTLSGNAVDPVLSTRPSGQFQNGLAIATYNSFASTSARYFTADTTGGPGTPVLYVNGASATGVALTKGTFYVLACTVTGLPPFNYMRMGQYTEFGTPFDAIADLAEIQVYQGAMTSGQVATVTAALRAKYAI